MKGTRDRFEEWPRVQRWQQRWGHDESVIIPRISRQITFSNFGIMPLGVTRLSLDVITPTLIKTAAVTNRYKLLYNCCTLN